MFEGSGETAVERPLPRKEDSVSYITVSGNVSADPELKFLPSGKAMARFSVAENRKWKDANGEEKEATTWHRCVAWGSIAENIAETVTKGMKVIAYGRLDQRDWEDDDGNKKSILEVNVSDLGPSLMWATASVSKVEKKGGGGSFSAPPANAYTDEPF
jgi:single-strand DNA-binding protein